MSDIIEDVAIPKEVKQTRSIATEFGIVLEEHEGFFNLNEVKMLVYGESGSGKTVFASSWPKCVFLDIDKGMSSVTKKVSRIPINKTASSTAWDSFIRAVNFLENRELHNFETVVVDSLNEMQVIAMRDTISKYPQIRRPYDDLASQSDYGKMLDEFDQEIRRVKALPMHVVLIAQVAPRVYETDDVQPQLVGKHTARNVCRMMDIVGYLYKQEGGEQAQAKKDRVMVFDAVNHITKDRSDMLPYSVVNPTFSEMYSYWQQQFETKEGE